MQCVEMASYAFVLHTDFSQYEFLKGQVLEAVKFELSNPYQMQANVCQFELPNVFARLQLLFGETQIIYHSLIGQKPLTLVVKLQTIVTFATKMKTLCNTLKSADMGDYFVNSPLLTDIPTMHHRSTHYQIQILHGNKCQTITHTALQSD